MDQSLKDANAKIAELEEAAAKRSKSEDKDKEKSEKKEEGDENRAEEKLYVLSPYEPFIYTLESCFIIFQLLKVPCIYRFHEIKIKCTTAILSSAFNKWKQR